MSSHHGALLSPGPPALSLPAGLLHHPPHPLVLHLPLPRGLQFTVLHRSVSWYFKFDRALIFFSRNKMIAESSESNPDQEFLENWTKWRLYLSVEPGNTVTVYPNTRLSLANMVGNNTISFPQTTPGFIFENLFILGLVILFTKLFAFFCSNTVTSCCVIVNLICLLRRIRYYWEPPGWLLG